MRKELPLFHHPKRSFKDAVIESKYNNGAIMTIAFVILIFILAVAFAAGANPTVEAVL